METRNLRCRRGQKSQGRGWTGWRRIHRSRMVPSGLSVPCSSQAAAQCQSLRLRSSRNCRCRGILRQSAIRCMRSASWQKRWLGQRTQSLCRVLMASSARGSLSMKPDLTATRFPVCYILSFSYCDSWLVDLNVLFRYILLYVTWHQPECQQSMSSAMSPVSWRCPVCLVAAQ